jgi:purine-cytosine permease-like protein
MKHKYEIIAFVAMCLMFAVGLVLIFSSPEMGQIAANAAVRRAGGSMDTDQFLLVFESAVSSFLAGGFILSLIGGLGLLGSGCILIKKR